MVAALTLCTLLILPRLFPPTVSLSQQSDPVPSVFDANGENNGFVDPQLQVDPDRLWQYLTELPSQRFSESDRQSTRHYLKQILETAGWTVRNQDFTVQDGNQEQHGINVIAELSQSVRPAIPDSQRENSSIRPPNTLLIGAHYDTVQGSPGADDNGTGVAATLELAQLLSPKSLNLRNDGHDGRSMQTDLSLPTDLSIKFVFFDLEESGLWGSQAFVNDDQERQDIAGAIILEMLGYACHTEGCQTYPPLPIEPPSQVGDFLAVVGDRNHPQLVEWFQKSPAPVPVYTLTVPTLGPLTPDLLRSDHVPFWRKDIGAVMVTDTANFRNPHYHQASDRPDTLDPTFFTAATQLVLDAIKLQNMHSGMAMN